MAKQVADFKGGHGIDGKESDEQLRRWKPEDWAKHQKKGNYNLSMVNLNFEIVDGTVQPVNKNDSLPDRFSRRLAEAGLVDPNARRKVKNIRTLGKYIFGGSRERMQEMAFGHTIEHTIDGDFSYLKRSPEIENWAIDVYNHVGKTYGFENIISFVVLLDELNPHAHCSILPINTQGHLNFKRVFLAGGQTKDNASQALLDFHSSLYEQVNCHYGLDRGDSIVMTGARHKSSEQYHRELNADIKKLETKIKSLHTMISNQQKILSSLDEQIADAQQLYENGELTKADLDDKIEKLNMEKERTLDAITKRLAQIEDAENELADLIGQNSDLQKSIDNLQGILSSLKRQFVEESDTAVVNGAFSFVVDSIRQQYDNETWAHRQDAIEESDLWYIQNNWAEIKSMALQLILGGTPQTIVNSCGGGGSTSDLRWDGRDDDDTDIQWSHRCVRKSVALHKAGYVLGGKNYNRQKGRG